eukprot:TRINITY_DN38204_c0_g1_i4.p1 TRINITY_DN38204_c0_g1~~TRINITY_DN38204_c0_g1_i4.p1  ORF type:complete len:508 (-),score=127.04 TRINITY_DN38204_c0_g1_i4:457-1980(-)
MAVEDAGTAAPETAEETADAAEPTEPEAASSLSKAAAEFVPGFFYALGESDQPAPKVEYDVVAALPVAHRKLLRVFYTDPMTGEAIPYYVGRLKSFSNSTGFGFLACHQAFEMFGTDVFIHKNHMVMPWQSGRACEFAVQVNNRGQPQAVDVRWLPAMMRKQPVPFTSPAAMPAPLPAARQKGGYATSGGGGGGGAGGLSAPPPPPASGALGAATVRPPPGLGPPPAQQQQPQQLSEDAVDEAAAKSNSNDRVEAPPPAEMAAPAVEHTDAAPIAAELEETTREEAQLSSQAVVAERPIPEELHIANPETEVAEGLEAVPTPALSAAQDPPQDCGPFSSIPGCSQSAAQSVSTTAAAMSSQALMLTMHTADVAGFEGSRMAEFSDAALQHCTRWGEQAKQGTAAFVEKAKDLAVQLQTKACEAGSYLATEAADLDEQYHLRQQASDAVARGTSLVAEQARVADDRFAISDTVGRVKTHVGEKVEHAKAFCDSSCDARCVLRDQDEAR